MLDKLKAKLIEAKIQRVIELEAKGDIDRAMKKYMLLLEEIKDIKDPATRELLKAEVTVRIANIDLYNKNFKEAYGLASQAEKISRKLDEKPILYTSLLIKATALYRQGKVMDAETILRQLLELKDKDLIEIKTWSEIILAKIMIDKTSCGEALELIDMVKQDLHRIRKIKYVLGELKELVDEFSKKCKDHPEIY